MATVQLPHKWRPRPYQMQAWGALEGGKRRVNLVWHRRAGKDDVSLHWTSCAAFERVGTYWYMLPQAEQARKAIWRAIDGHTGMSRIDSAFPKEIRKRCRDQEMNIELANGSLWQVVGSDNFNSLVGSPPVGVVFSEWPLSDPQAWGFISPILEENGGWAIFNGTPRGPNHAKTLFEYAQSNPDVWFAERLTAAETGVFSENQLASIKAELMGTYGRDHGEALYRQEYECSFEAAILGAFYAREMQDARDEGRICKVPYERGIAVHTAWDLGIADSTAIWFFQAVGREIRIIDYHEASGVGLEEYARILAERGYVYGTHYLPHDIEVRELGSGKSRRDTLYSLGLSNVVTVPQHAVLDGINASRRLLGRTWFDETKTKRGVDCLLQYRRDWDDKGRCWRASALHDWTSHGADAFRMLAAGFCEPEISKKRDKWADAWNDKGSGKGSWMSW